MKLNKEVCRVCINKKRYYLWNEYDDSKWDFYKHVICIYRPPLSSSNREGIISINKIPECCPYKLEHIVNEA